jgi:hypothetical protein
MVRRTVPMTTETGSPAMGGALIGEAVVDDGTLLALLAPATRYGRTVGDRRFWFLLVRNAAIASGHPQSTELLMNQPELVADPVRRLGEIVGWLQGLVIGDPASAAVAVRDARPRILKWGKWQGWTDEFLTFMVMNLGDAVLYAAETFKAAPLTEDERADLYASVAALAALIGLDEASIPADHVAHRAYMDAQLQTTIGRRGLHNMIGRLEIPQPESVPGVLWTAGQAPSRHLLKVVLGATLPPVTRARFGIELSARERVEWAAIALTLRTAGLAPDRIRLVPAARRG